MGYFINRYCVSFPSFLYFGFDDFPLTWVCPNVAQNPFVPSLAHLSATVEALKTLEDNLHHDVTEYEVRQHAPVATRRLGHYNPLAFPSLYYMKFIKL